MHNYLNNNKCPKVGSISFESTPLCDHFYYLIVAICTRYTTLTICHLLDVHVHLHYHSVSSLQLVSVIPDGMVHVAAGSTVRCHVVIF